MSSGEHHTGRNIALVGGAALLAWWLLRGKRRGFGSAGSRSGGESAAATPAAPCRVWIRADRIEVDGAPTDLAGAVARCRVHGRAEVHATGDAITRSIMDVLRAFQRAGVSVDASPELIHLAKLAAVEPVA